MPDQRIAVDQHYAIGLPSDGMICELTRQLQQQQLPQHAPQPAQHASVTQKSSGDIVIEPSTEKGIHGDHS